MAGSTLLVMAYAWLLCAPRPLFPFAVKADRLEMRSDRPIEAASGARVLRLAERKLAHSPLFTDRANYRVYLCNSTWRQVLFFNKDYGVGGVAPYPLTSNVFLRDARVEDDRLISPRGNPVPGDRTLDYFVAHELTHQLTGRALGPVRYFELPQWVREGYADYVGKGDSFDYAQARNALLAGAPEMDWKRSGLYWRFHLLVAFLLDRQGWTVERLLKNPPSETWVETAVRNDGAGGR